MLRWIEAFLTGRRHWVSLSGEQSDWIQVTSEITQVLGPILFVIFINDISIVLKNCCKLFADDATLYIPVLSEDATLYRPDLLDNAKLYRPDLLDDAKLYRPVLSEDATLYRPVLSEDTTLYRPDLLEDATLYRPVLSENTTLYRPDLLEDATLYRPVLSEMKCKRLLIGRGKNHCLAAIKKAHSILGLIKPSFSVKDKIMLPSLYFSMVQPYLEYGSIVWGPHFKVDMKVIRREPQG